MIELSFIGTPYELMSYLQGIEIGEEDLQNNWTDRPEYNKDGMPNE